MGGPSITEDGASSLTQGVSDVGGTLAETLRWIGSKRTGAGVLCVERRSANGMTPTKDPRLDPGKEEALPLPSADLGVRS